MPRPTASIFHPTTPTDVRRTVWGLLLIAALGLTYSALYGRVYSFHSPSGIGLPDVSVGSEVLFSGLRAVALLCAAWAIGLAVATSPETAKALRNVWQTAVAAERRSRRAWIGALALGVAYAVARALANSETETALLVDLTAGTARTPFQYRTLVPLVVRGTVALVPALGRNLWLPYVAVEALAAVGVWAAFRLLLRPYVSDAPSRAVAALAVFAPLALNLASPFRHNALFFPWDTLSVALFTCGLALIQQKRWDLFYPLFILATVNRETTCFLTLAFVLGGLGRVPLRTLALHGGAQLALWMGVKSVLVWAYSANQPLVTAEGSGGLFIMPIVRNIGVVSGVPGLLLLVSAMGGLWVVLIGLAGRVGAPDLRRLFRFVPVFLVGMFLVGELPEVRIYSELIPLVAAGLVVAMQSVLREAGSHAATQPPEISPERQKRNAGGDGYASAAPPVGRPAALVGAPVAAGVI